LISKSDSTLASYRKALNLMHHQQFDLYGPKPLDDMHSSLEITLTFLVAMQENPLALLVTFLFSVLPPHPQV
jgi:hypothetical protein